MYVLFYYTQFLSTCVVGASLEERDEEEDSASVKSDQLPPKEGVWKVSGTLKKPNAEKPDWVQEVLPVSEQGKNYNNTGAPGDFAPEMQKRALEKKKMSP